MEERTRDLKRRLMQLRVQYVDDSDVSVQPAAWRKRFGCGDEESPVFLSASIALASCTSLGDRQVESADTVRIVLIMADDRATPTSAATAARSGRSTWTLLAEGGVRMTQFYNTVADRAPPCSPASTAPGRHRPDGG